MNVWFAPKWVTKVQPMWVQYIVEQQSEKQSGIDNSSYSVKTTVRKNISLRIALMSWKYWD